MGQGNHTGADSIGTQQADRGELETVNQNNGGARAMIETSRSARWVVMFAILASCIGCDQATKRIARSQLKGMAPRSYCGDLVRLQYAENPGAFLGLGGHLPPAARWGALIVFNGLLATGIAGVLLWGRDLSARRLAAGALLLSGALGNLIDRLRFDGLVTDFLNLGVGPLRTGIFNVADLAITLGALLLVLPVIASRETSPAGPQSRD
jgi:signal peptidase II